MPKKALTAAFVSMLVGMALLELYVRTFEARATGGAKVGLLVATSDLRSGEVLARDKLGVRAIPQAYVEGRHVRASDVDRVVGARLLVPEKVGETLLWTDIAGMSSRQRALSALVPEGMRAFSVHAANAAFGGLLEPGDRVDVVLGGRELEVDGAKTPPVVENVVVLAIGDRTEVRSELDSEREASGDAQGLVTLSVSPDQARALARASGQSELRLLLRNPDDVLTHVNREVSR